MTTKQRAIAAFKGEIVITTSDVYLPYNHPEWHRKQKHGLVSVAAFLEKEILKSYTGQGIKPRTKSLWQHAKTWLLGPNTSPFTVTANPKKTQDIVIKQEKYSGWSSDRRDIITTRIHIKAAAHRPRFKLIQSFLELKYSFKKSLKDYLVRRRAIKQLTK